MTEIVKLVIGILFCVNGGIFFYLYITSNSIKKKLEGYLINVVKGNVITPDVDKSQNLDQIIDAHIKTISDGLMIWTKAEKENTLLRMELKEESKHQYDDLNFFVILYSLARSIIEVFPLLGILGTLLAIGAGFGGEEKVESEQIKSVIKNFKDSVWVSAGGISCAIFYTLVNSYCEPIFEKLVTNKSKINDLISEAKKSVRFSANSIGSSQ